MQIFTLIPCVGGELELSTDCSDGCGEGRQVHNDPQQLPGLSLVTNFCLPYSFLSKVHLQWCNLYLQLHGNRICVLRHVCLCGKVKSQLK